jgi:pimeloyl-ACP methyl ester carboxylesterase
MSAMSPWQTGTIDNRGVRLHYRRKLSARQQLLLLHGFSDDGGCWLPIANRLTGTYDVTVLDARGHGRSDAPPGRYGYAEHASDTATAIVSLGLTKPTLLGHSMGAITALETARRYPKLVGAIALEDPPPWWVPQRAKRDSHEQIQTWIRRTKRHTPRELIAMAARDNPSWPVAERMPWAESKLRLSVEAIDGLQAASPDWGATLTAIRCPTLLICGDPAAGAIVAGKDTDALRRLLPQLQTTHLPGTGHSIRRDAPGPYLKAIRSFFAAVAAGHSSAR